MLRKTQAPAAPPRGRRQKIVALRWGVGYNRRGASSTQWGPRWLCGHDPVRLGVAI
jgi:hypothetical protein